MGKELGDRASSKLFAINVKKMINFRISVFIFLVLDNGLFFIFAIK